MLSKLYIQIINTDDDGEYDYHGGQLSNNDWADMMCQHVYETSQYVNPWAGRVEQYQHMMAQARNDREHEYIANKYGRMLQMGNHRDGLVEDYQEREITGFDDGYGHRAQDVECMCEVTDVDGNDIDIDFFRQHGNDMFVLCLNIMPTEDDINKSESFSDNMMDDRVRQEYIPWEDAEGEIRFWIKDSEGIINDKTYDDDMKLRSLPGKRLRFNVDGELYSVACCKIIEMRNDETNPYRFAVLGDKMERIN